MMPELIPQFQLTGHKDAVYCLLPAAGDTFISAGGDGQVVQWSYTSLGPGRLLARLPQTVYSLAWAVEGELLLAGCRFGLLYLLDVAGGKLGRQTDLKEDIFDLKILPEGRLAAVTAKGHLHILDAQSLEIISSQQPCKVNGREIALGPDKRIMATGWSDGHIRLYEMDGLREIAGWEAHDKSVFCLAFGPTGEYLISGGRDAMLCRWEVSSGAQLQKLPAHMFTLNDIALHPSGEYLATGSRDKSVKIWRSETLELLKVVDKMKQPQSHTHSVNKLLWAGDGDTLISTGDDKRIIVWQYRDAS